MQSWLKVACLVLIACFAGVLLYSRLVAVDASADAGYRHALREVDTLDGALTTDLLEAQSGLVNHYDNLVRRMSALRATRDRLAHPPSFLPDASRRQVSASVRRYSELLARESQLVETFKFDHAVLRNSLRFFPRAARELANRIAGTSEGAGLVRELNRFFSDVLLFDLFSEQSLAPVIDRVAAGLDAVDAPWPTPDQRRAMALLAKHAAVIVDRKPRVDRTVTRFLGVAASASAAVRAVRNSYERGYDAVVQTSRRCRLVLFLIALGIVLSGAAYIISSLRRSGLALRGAKAELEGALESLRAEKQKQAELAELKARFSSMTSHQFRTPLSVILSSADLLEAYGPRWSKDKQDGHLHKIQAAAQDMKAMLDEVLLLGRAESVSLDFKPRALDLDAFCADVVESMQLQAGMEHEIVYSSSGDLDGARVDERLLARVLDNLLSNAIKYSSPSEAINFELRREGAEAVFVIADRGIGIPERDRERLFEAYHRGENAGNVEGTGLGLAIVHKALEAHRGTISVDSGIDEGTTFTVRLPLWEMS